MVIVVIMIGMLLSYVFNCNKNDLTITNERVKKSIATFVCFLAFTIYATSYLNNWLGISTRDTTFNNARCMYALKQLYVPTDKYTVKNLKQQSLFNKTYQYATFIIEGDDSQTMNYYKERLSTLGWVASANKENFYTKQDDSLELEIKNSTANNWDINIYAYATEQSKDEMKHLNSMFKTYQ